MLVPVQANSAQTISACINIKSGAMRLISKGACKKTEKKISWNIQGIAGLNGKDGAAGANGKDGLDGRIGNTILSGTIDPTSSVGVAGDFYINTSTNKLFGPKTTTWPSGISLVGPTGATGASGGGATGATGATGPSGTNSSMMWFSPRDLLGNGGTGTDTSTVKTIQLNTNNWAEVLELDQLENRTLFRALPKGWPSATSVTIRIYWLTTSADVSFSPEIYADYVKDDTDLSTSFLTCSGACPITSDTVTAGVKILNVMSYTRSDLVATPVEGGMFAFSLYRYDTGGGLVYILGVSVSANIP